MLTQVGTHTFEVEGDSIWATYRGPVTLAELKQLTDMLGSILQRFGYAIIVCELSQAGGMAADGRRHLSDYIKRVHTQSIFVGAGLLQQTVIMMIERMSLLFGGAPRNNRFVNSRDEALAILPTARAELQEQVRHKTSGNSDHR
jgi:hypothetical protein